MSAPPAPGEPAHGGPTHTGPPHDDSRQDGPARDASVEPVPPAAASAFGDRLALAERYAELLCGQGVVRGLIGPREPGRIWTRHLLNSAALASFLAEGATVTDLGSGAGLPGIPLALARPDLTMTLLEPQSRRMRFLELVRAELDLELTLVQARAEDGPSGADIVVARAVAPLPRLLELAIPLLRPGGTLLAHKGARAAAELAEARGILAEVSPLDVSVHPLGSVDEEATIVRIVLGDEALPLGRSSRTPARSARGGRSR